MKSKSWVLFFLSFYLLCCTVVIAKNENVVQQKGSIDQYSIQLQNEIAMLSRDGSKAYAVKDGEVITKPGSYYLTRTTETGQIKIETFTIPYASVNTFFRVGQDQALEEALKQALEQKSTKLSVQMTYGNYTFEALCEKVKSILNKVVDTYPALTYTEYSISSSAGNKPFFNMEIAYPLQNVNTFKQYDQKAKGMIPTIINNNITAFMKDYEREWVLYSYIAGHLTYAKDLTLQMPHTLQGGLVDGIAVCDGYAKTLMYLLNSVGVPTTIVTGKTGNIGHAWNMVMIQNQMYHVDATWGDQDGDQLGNLYDYFNESDAYMARSHTWDRKSTTPANQVMYSSLYMPIDIPDTYRIHDPKEWNVVRKQIQKDAISETTLIFYNQSRNRWNKDTLIKQIISEENKGIQYSVIEKYDALVIQYLAK